MGAAVTLYVRTYYVDSARQYDERTVPDIDTGLELAMKFARETHVRSVAIMDDYSTVWAQFNLLWQAPT